VRRSNSSGSRILGQEPARREAALRSDHVALPIVVTIPRADNEQLTFGSRALFVIEVLGFGVMSTAKYPFEKFEELYAAVTKVTRFALPPLPQSQWFGTSKQDVVEERRGKLEGLLQKMLMLQEVVDDVDEVLWRFLQLPKAAVVAARFLCCAPASRCLWLQRLWETSAEPKGHLPLQHPLVEKQLVQLCRFAVRSASSMEGEAFREMAEQGLAGDLAAEADDAFLQASIACELLARIFGRIGEADRPASLGSEPQRHEFIEVLLLCCQINISPAEPRSPRWMPATKDADCAESSDSMMAQPRPLRETAAKALRTLARSHREAWTHTLGSFLDIGGLSHLAATAAADPGEGAVVGGRQPLQRLVTELIIRGFEKPVVQKIAASSISKERRQLLNTLFLSGDTFVRIMVGLLLAGLRCEEGFADARQADAGLQDILEDLHQKVDELAQDIDICLLLLEDPIWHWLSSLVSALPVQVNSFALLVITHVVQPSAAAVFETGGLHERLMVLCAPEADPESRFYASKIMLSAYRGGTRAPPPQPELAYICSCLAINFQAKLEHDIGQQDLLGVEVEKSRGWAQLSASFDDLVQKACEDATDLRTEAAEWTISVTAAGESADIALKSQMQVRNSLQEHNICLDTAASQIGDGNPTVEEANIMAELRDREAALADREQSFQHSELAVQAVGEERMEYTRSLAEHDEVAFQLAASISEAQESAQQAASQVLAPGLAPYLNECKARHEETLENIATMRVAALELDDRLSVMCDPLPQWRREVSNDRQLVEELRAKHRALRQDGGAIDTWAGLMDRQRHCGEDILSVQQSLRGVSGCVMSEREHRRNLRASVQRLVQSLTVMDNHLESLESWDSLEAEGGQGALSPWAATQSF